MILRLDPQDSSVLTRIAQYAQQDISPELLERLLGSLSPDAREVGWVLLGHKSEASVSSDVAETASYFRQWAGKNRAYSKKRSSLAAASAATGLIF